MNRPIHFEIHVEDFDRAQGFYGALFGWSFQPMGDIYRLITTGPDDQHGINGGMIRRMGGLDQSAMTPVIAWVCTVDVEDVDASMAKALSLGGVTALPKMAVPNVGWLAYAKDTEGNVFGMMQPDPSAA